MREQPDDTSPLPYFPARLGMPVERRPKDSREDAPEGGRIDPRRYEAWRESFAIEPKSWSERPEAEHGIAGRRRTGRRQAGECRRTAKERVGQHLPPPPDLWVVRTYRSEKEPLTKTVCHNFGVTFTG